MGIDVRWTPSIDHIMRDAHTYNDLLSDAEYDETLFHVTKDAREIRIAVPRGTTTPRPYVLYFQPSGDYGMKGGGLLDFSALKSVLHTLVSQGIVIVFLSAYTDDTYFCMVDGGGYDFNCNATKDTTCWSTGKDKTYLDAAMLIINKFSSVSYDDMIVLGYSAGAQMVSLAVDKFPDMRVSETLRYPNIRGAILVAGGSQFCYAYEYNTDRTKLPAPFQECIDPKIRLCCPKGVTEQRFVDARNCASRPPTLLCQTKNDSFADPNASIYYYETVERCGGPVAIVRTDGFKHGMTSEHAPYAVGFIINIFKVKPKHGVKRHTVLIAVAVSALVVSVGVILIIRIRQTKARARA